MLLRMSLPTFPFFPPGSGRTLVEHVLQVVKTFPSAASGLGCLDAGLRSLAIGPGQGCGGPIGRQCLGDVEVAELPMPAFVESWWPLLWGQFPSIDKSFF